MVFRNLKLDDTDEAFQFYSLIEKRSEKINTDNESLVTQAVKAYVEPMTEKMGRKAATT